MQGIAGLENNIEGRSLAWALEFPGCFAYGADGPEAIINLATAFLNYKIWVGQHTGESWLAEIDQVDVRLSDVWTVYEIDQIYDVCDGGPYSVNAWFRHDWKPLTWQEVQRGLKVLSFSRADLLELIKDLPEETLDREYAGERWSIRGIVRHIANAEWWYQTRLGLENLDRRALPENIHERLAVVRARSEEILPQLEGKVNVAGIEGELWSPRKMLRRSAWHERDHIEHIRKLLASL